MNLIAKKTALFVVAAVLPMACGGDAYEEPAAEAEAPADDPGATSVATMDGLLNPNLALEAEMTAAGVSAEIRAAIMDGRPFMNMEAVDALLAAHMDEAAREELYATMWIPLNLNTASNEEILLVPGVGDRMAHEFDEYRPYTAMAQFRREKGKYVDDAEVERLARYVFVPIDLNSATREEILAVPGVGERMAHEFEEYRPYTDMAQFRREMGKYVDEGEVARLERYVVIN